MKYAHNTMIFYILLLLAGCSGVNPDLARAVNNSVNTVQYVSDIDNYGVSNYYADTDDFYKRGGDCEDYARAKYIGLKAMGVSDSQMSYIMARTPHFITHTMLGVKSETGWMVLDNNSKDVENEKYLMSNYRDVSFIPATKFNKNWEEKGER